LFGRLKTKLVVIRVIKNIDFEILKTHPLVDMYVISSYYLNL